MSMGYSRTPVITPKHRKEAGRDETIQTQAVHISAR
jgi:hypothetical protein